MASDMPRSDSNEVATDGGTNQTDDVVRELRDIRFVLDDIESALQEQGGDSNN